MRFTVKDIGANVGDRHIRIQETIHKKWCSKFIIGEGTACPWHSTLSLSITLDYPAYPFSSDIVGIISHFHQNELSMPTVCVVQV